MLEFHHPNVLNLIGVCFDCEDQVPVIVLPLMTNGDLRMFLLEKHKLLKPKKAYPEVCCPLSEYLQRETYSPTCLHDCHVNILLCLLV